MNNTTTATTTYLGTKPSDYFHELFEHRCATAKPGTDAEAFAHNPGERVLYLHTVGASFVFRVAADYISFTEAKACEYCDKDGECCEACGGTLVQYVNEGSFDAESSCDVLDALVLIDSLGGDARRVPLTGYQQAGLVGLALSAARDGARLGEQEARVVESVCSAPRVSLKEAA